MSEEQEAVAEVSSVTETDEKPTAEEASPEEEKSEQESETTVNENGRCSMIVSSGVSGQSV